MKRKLFLVAAALAILGSTAACTVESAGSGQADT